MMCTRKQILRCFLILLLFTTLLSVHKEHAFARGEEWVPHAGEIYAIRVPGFDPAQKLSLEQAQTVVAQYRWIHVNDAEEDVPKAQRGSAMLAAAVGNHGLVLIYMPRHTADGQRNEYHPNFVTSLRTLLEQSLKDGKELLVTAKSYGVHQALRVIRRFDTPSIMLIGIAPAFGVFGNVFSENVRHYVGDVHETRSKYCMIASEGDPLPWNAGGAAFRRGIMITGDPRVYRSMDKNKSNVDYVLLQGPGHGINHYLDHGLVEAMRRCVNHFGMHDNAVGNILFKQEAPSIPGTMRTLSGNAWLVPLIFLGM